MATQDRKAIHAYLEADSHDTLHEFCGEQGISVTGFLEALASQLTVHPSHEDSVPPEGRLVPMDAVIRDARKTDALRRRRS